MLYRKIIIWFKQLLCKTKTEIIAEEPYHILTEREKILTVFDSTNKIRLVKVICKSIYFKDYNRNGRFDPNEEKLYNLSERMSWAHPMMAEALKQVVVKCREYEYSLTMSDMFRSNIMQLQAHLDYKLGLCYVNKDDQWICIDLLGVKDIRDEAKRKNITLAPYGKTAYSPPPKSSMHELGLAVDVNLVWDGATGKTYKNIDKARIRRILIECEFDDIADINQSEEWHFDFRKPFMSEYIEIMKYGDARQKIPEDNLRILARSAIVKKGFEVLELPPYEDKKFETIIIT